MCLRSVVSKIARTSGNVLEGNEPHFIRLLASSEAKDLPPQSHCIQMHCAASDMPPILDSVYIFFSISLVSDN